MSPYRSQSGNRYRGMHYTSSPEHRPLESGFTIYSGANWRYREKRSYQRCLAVDFHGCSNRPGDCTVDSTSYAEMELRPEQGYRVHHSTGLFNTTTTERGTRADSPENARFRSPSPSFVAVAWDSHLEFGGFPVLLEGCATVLSGVGSATSCHVRARSLAPSST